MVAILFLTFLFLVWFSNGQQANTFLYRKIINKDKVINFNNIEKFVSEKDPEKAFEYLKLDLDKYEVIYF